ncbi:MAG: superoxide dismutase family protein [Xanthomonadaceae bacterium]|nr:superoxide dismutase family protein [Xanthomonadaceae bacterium]
MKYLFAAAALAVSTTGAAADDGVEVLMRAVDRDGLGPVVGHVTVSTTAHGLLFSPRLHGMPPGIRGFHVHENASCASSRAEGRTVPGGAAGSHLDPEGSGLHGTPWGDGHLGDLPALYVAADGTADYPVLAPRLTMDQVRGRALMVHAGGDNHADHPEPLGGGGARLFCGVID